jgi:hypothetical protein
MIWDSCNSDEGVLIDLYKVLAEVAGVNTSELQYFMNKILTKGAGVVRMQEIELLESVCRKIQARVKKDESGLVNKILEYLWESLFTFNNL